MSFLQTAVLMAFILAFVSCKHCGSGNLIDQSLALETTTFGTTSDGKTFKVFTLTSDKGVEAKISEYGAILTSLKVPDRDGKSEEITLG